MSPQLLPTSSVYSNPSFRVSDYPPVPNPRVPGQDPDTHLWVLLPADGITLPSSLLLRERSPMATREQLGPLSGGCGWVEVTCHSTDSSGSGDLDPSQSSLFCLRDSSPERRLVSSVQCWVGGARTLLLWSCLYVQSSASVVPDRDGTTSDRVTRAHRKRRHRSVHEPVYTRESKGVSRTTDIGEWTPSISVRVWSDTPYDSKSLRLKPLWG